MSLRGGYSHLQTYERSLSRNANARSPSPTPPSSHSTQSAVSTHACANSGHSAGTTLSTPSDSLASPGAYEGMLSVGNGSSTNPGSRSGNDSSSGSETSSPSKDGELSDSILSQPFNIEGGTGVMHDGDNAKLHMQPQQQQQKQKQPSPNSATCLSNTCEPLHHSGDSTDRPHSIVSSDPAVLSQRPPHLPGMHFSAEEYWQLRRAFMIFAEKYKTRGKCGLKRMLSGRCKTKSSSSSSNRSARCRSPAPAPDKFTLDSFTRASVDSKHAQSLGLGLMESGGLGQQISLTQMQRHAQPLLPRVRTTSGRNGNEEDGIETIDEEEGETGGFGEEGVSQTGDDDAADGGEEEMVGENSDEELIRMSDFSYCYAAWTGLTCCNLTHNLHLFWPCDVVESQKDMPCVTFGAFVQGFADYCFAAIVPPQVCTDPQARRKRLFRSLTSEVFDSIRRVSRPQFDWKRTLIEYACMVCPPLYLLRLPGVPFRDARPIEVMPPFTSPRRYLVAIHVLWMVSVIVPLILPHLDTRYEHYTKSNKLCEIETFGLVSLYLFMSLYWACMLGSQFVETRWALGLKRDLDWLSLCRINVPLNCLSQIRSAKDIFLAIFSEVYCSKTMYELMEDGEVQRRGGGGHGQQHGHDGTGVGGVASSSSLSTPSSSTDHRKYAVDSFSRSRCATFLLLSFGLSFPVAFLPTLYRATVAHVHVVPDHETIPMMIVCNFMISSVGCCTLLMNLIFLTWSSYRDFQLTLEKFSDLFILSKSATAAAASRNTSSSQALITYPNGRSSRPRMIQKKEIPYLPLNNPLNVRSWEQMRRYLLEIHMPQKVAVLENLYGLLLVTLLSGLVFVISRTILTERTFASSILVMYMVGLFAFQLLCMIFKGVAINQQQAGHVNLLCEQAWGITRVLLSFPYKCDSIEKERLMKTEHLLSQLAQNIKHSRTTLCIWGIPLESSFRNMIITVLFSAASSGISFWLRNIHA